MCFYLCCHIRCEAQIMHYFTTGMDTIVVTPSFATLSISHKMGAAPVVIPVHMEAQSEHLSGFSLDPWSSGSWYILS
jgi:hypothetical protein